jgi:sialate O-acetylesterase
MRNFSALFLIGLCFISNAALKTPRIFSHNMVLQQNMSIPVWGWAAPGSHIRIELNGNTTDGITSADGNWKVYLNPMKSGGPFIMKISGDGNIEFTNVMIGEVWLASGQSNMQFNMSFVNNSKAEIADAKNYPDIRLFYVPNVVSIKPENDLPGGEWKICDTSSIAKFSAVGYLFGRNIHKYLNVPVGIIEAAWGGTPAESWTSYEMLYSMTDFRENVEKMKASKNNFDELLPGNESNIRKIDSLTKHADKGVKMGVHLTKFDDSGWNTKTMPYDFVNEKTEIRGYIWLRKTIIISKEYKAKNMQLIFGRLNQTDQTYFNGELISNDKPTVNIRNYDVPGKLVKEGKNVIAIKLLKNQRSSGGICESPCELRDPLTNKQIIDLAGDWKYNEKIETPFPKVYYLSFYPTVLFNSMVNPVIPYAIKGVIWYQGESNGTEGYQYRELFPKMIEDWRVRWQEGYFPFLYVQITNFLKKDSIPVMDPWPEMREAQLFTLGCPNTAMASAIDLGEMFDIHPKNKQDVALRLFIAAKNKAYGENIEYSGPVYKNYSVEENKIRIEFTHTGTGMEIRNPGTLHDFAIAREDKKFYWAKAKVENNSVLVWNDNVPHPVAVRYGWANDPDISLYNSAGLPASPFRTDDWIGVTFGKTKFFDLDFLDK